MKVCIVTVYNSENCGSYWQAFALCSYLKQGGCDVSFMKRKRKGTSHSIGYVGRQTLKWILKGEIEKAKAQVQQYWAFDESIKKFKIVDEIDANFKNGILSLTCPKKEQVETKKTISIKESE